jgi:hypothetical protein
MRSRSRRSFVALVCALSATGAALGVAPAAHAVPGSTIKLIATTTEITATARSGGGVSLDPGVWIGAVGGDFQIRLSRADLRSEITAAQTASDGSQIQPIPAEDLAGWDGLARFLHVSVLDAGGHSVFRSVIGFCPNAWERDRIDDTGPIEPTYPEWCGGGPFTVGTVWGIDEGWAMDPLQWFGLRTGAIDPGTYTLRVWIDPHYASLFQIAAGDDEVDLTLRVRRPRRAAAERPTVGGSSSLSASVPVIVPPADSVPDLAALPAWGMRTMHRGERDFLAFGATVWNTGPSPMIVEGYRRTGEPTMDGWQYFTDPSGDVIGKADVGTLEYDARPGHEHWHFEQFATYSLTDVSKTEIVRSEKVSFCLAPTDPIDLLADGAEWRPYLTGLGSACGEPDSLWTRESLPVGWGDTYFQWLPGQSFDITDVPNGRYYVRVGVNPLGALFDGSSANDVSYRRIRLRGRPGHRWVIVPPYQGVDTDACVRCFRSAGQPAWDGMVTRRRG